MLITGESSTSSPFIIYLFTAFYVLSLYNAIGVFLLVFITFKTYRGSYFWSLIVASCGLIVSTIGTAVNFYTESLDKYPLVMCGVGGWVLFVTGHSLVLWSRLHLVVQSKKVLKGVLIMIITDAIIFQTPTVVFSFVGSLPNNPPALNRLYNTWEFIQVSAFCTQEFIISGIYIRETLRLLKFTFSKEKKKIIYQLLAINVIVILMDVIILGVQYSHMRPLQIALKGLVYSMKLTLEFAILGRLVDFARGTNQIESADTGESHGTICKCASGYRASCDEPSGS